MYVGLLQEKENKQETGEDGDRQQTRHKNECDE